MAELLVAKEILKTLGGSGRITAMVGARHIAGDATSLRFKILARAKLGIKAISITLTPMDTYTVTMHSVKKLEYTERVRVENVYAADLVKTLERETGLAFHL